MWWAFVFYAFLAGIIEQQLREREARLQELFDEAPIGYHELDTEGRITRINRTELEMYGYSKEQMLGKPVWEFYVDKIKSQQAVEAKLAGNIPPGQAFERKIQRIDGIVIPVLIEDRLLYDKEGSIRGIRSTIQNITKRKQAEESLARESNLLRTLINNMPDNIFVKDTKSRFVTSGIRIGTPSVTTRGFKEAEMKQVAIWINSVYIGNIGRILRNEEECIITTAVAGYFRWVIDRGDRNINGSLV